MFPASHLGRNRQIWARLLPSFNQHPRASRASFKRLCQQRPVRRFSGSSHSISRTQLKYCMPQLSQSTLGLVRGALEALIPDSLISAYDKRQFWEQRLFDFDFPPEFIKAAASYGFNWTRIIPDLYSAAFHLQRTGHFPHPKSSQFCNSVLSGLAVFALYSTKNSKRGESLQQALARDGFDTTGSANDQKKDIPEELEALPRKETLTSDLTARLEKQNSLVSVLFIDLDNFKAVNDQLGHDAGDRCLVSVVKVMRDSISGKGMLYRYGGDEFCVLLPNFSTSEGAATAERIRAAIDSADPGDSVKVTSSIGVASSEAEHLTKPETLLKAADEAMYRSKRATKNCVSIYSVSDSTPETSSKANNLLAASQEGFDVQITAGYDTGLVALITNHADEEFLILGVSVEWNGTALGKIHCPLTGTVWRAPAKQRFEIQWPGDAGIVGQFVKLKGQYRGWFQEFIDFIFQCTVRGKPLVFRKRVKVQANPVNRHLTQL